MDKETNLSENVKSIKPINVDTVHKICSGQVVLSLAIAVKELVENSLDAGASNIEVRLKNYGIELVEVSDNGTGVIKDNFSALTLKYHTSKLNDYSDLLGVSSFGFRGEALSSLCALSDLTVITRHKSAELATKLEFNHKGEIVKKTSCSRQVGTTVSLANLFASLPVRQKELHKNAKREFNKMTQLLYGYCLISVGVKITCTNQTASNQKSLVVATLGSTSYKDNIASVFGSKQLNTLLELTPIYTTNIKENIMKGLSGEVEKSDENIFIEDVEIDLSEDSNEAVDLKKCTQESDISLSQCSLKSQGYKNIVDPITFSCFISSCAHGSGRSSSDRQFYFVNSRPCEPPKIMKLINEVYRQFNPNQYPFIFLNIELDRSSVDVNVTPDKRKVFLTKEKNILDILKASMLKLFESIPRTLKVENSSQSVNENKANVDQPRIFTSFLSKFASKSADLGSYEQTSACTKTVELKRKSSSMLNFISTKTMKYETQNKQNIHEFIKNENKLSDADIDENIKFKIDIKTEQTESLEAIEHVKDDNIETNYGNNIENQNAIEIIGGNSTLLSNTKPTIMEPKEIVFLEATDAMPSTQIRTIDEVIFNKSRTNRYKTNTETPKRDVNKTKTIVTDKEDIGKYNRVTVQLKTSLEHVTCLAKVYEEQKENQPPERCKFRTTINPVFNKQCEDELSKEISKSDFKNMSVIGQFNLGFIITKLDDDLFIIDQHATDEIYNFETLQKTTELTSQNLVIPQQLELTGVNEQILMDNLDIFKKNGFLFDIDENAPPTKRVKLLTIPMSKNWVFGKDDIEELLFMLRESPSEYCRPSRVRAMFASRACRKSVMIGTALSKADMKTLVEHMADIDKPWNCPHGRPTIRHLVNLSIVRTDDRDV